MAAKAESDPAKVRNNLIDPAELALSVHEARPLADDLSDWHSYLTSKGATRQHALLNRNRVSRVIELARVDRISRLAPSKIQAALKTIRDEGATNRTEKKGVSLRSLHHYTRAIKGFSRWLWKDGRSRVDALAHLTSPNPDPDRRHERRPLTEEELAELVKAAECGPVVYKVAGSDRAMFYRVAAATGFRANELRSLTPESFDLGSNWPAVTVKAADSKSRRDDHQPLPPALVPALRSWIAQKPPERPLWGSLTKHTADMIRHDLDAAGIAYRDDNDRVADFHSLRATYISLIVSGGASVKTAQTLARHSTPSLTIGIYARASVHDLAGAVESLRDLTMDRPRPRLRPWPQPERMDA
jgi:integrase